MAKKVDRDEEHLRLLGIGHKVLAGLMALFGTFPLIHLGLGIAILAGAFETGGSAEAAPPEFVGYMFVAIATLMIAFGWSLAAANWVVGKRIKERRSHTLCQVVSGIDCLWFPFGTALGVMSLIVLNRPSVRREFGAAGGDVSARRKVGNTRCPYCHDSLDDEEAVACTACLAPHHKDCWDETGTCSNCGAAERYAHVECTSDGEVQPSPPRSLKE